MSGRLDLHPCRTNGGEQLGLQFGLFLARAKDFRKAVVEFASSQCCFHGFFVPLDLHVQVDLLVVVLDSGNILCCLVGLAAVDANLKMRRVVAVA